MFLLTCKGRGYYNGQTPSYRSDHNHKKSDKFNTYVVEGLKFKFKRDFGVVKSVYSYPTREEAETALLGLKEQLQTWVDQGDSWENERDSFDYNFRTSTRTKYKVTYHYSTDCVKSLKKILDTIEVFEIEEYLAPKRTKKQKNKREMRIVKSHSDEESCDVCQITMVKDEPYFSVKLPQWNTFQICRNCMFLSADKLEMEYNKHPHYEDITTAWELESISRD